MNNRCKRFYNKMSLVSMANFFFFVTGSRFTYKYLTKLELFALASSSLGKKKIINVDYFCQCNKTVFSSSLAKQPNKLECSLYTKFYSLDICSNTGRCSRRVGSGLTHINWTRLQRFAMDRHPCLFSFFVNDQ
jgi:hypothetical protein